MPTLSLVNLTLTLTQLTLINYAIILWLSLISIAAAQVRTDRKLRTPSESWCGISAYLILTSTLINPEMKLPCARFSALRMFHKWSPPSLRVLILQQIIFRSIKYHYSKIPNDLFLIKHFQLSLNICWKQKNNRSTDELWTILSLNKIRKEIHTSKIHFQVILCTKTLTLYYTIL